MFMSSGKDTSRMIKFYGSVCEDAGLGKRLVELRDVIKEGKDGENERNEMREMAESAIRGAVNIPIDEKGVEVDT